MNHACRNEKHIAGLDIHAVDERRHAGLIRQGSVDRSFKFFPRDLAREAVVEAGVRARGKHDPGLGFAVGAVKVFSGKCARGVYLHRKANGAVEVLDQYAERFAAAEAVFPVLFQELRKRKIVPSIMEIPSKGPLLTAFMAWTVDATHSSG